ncbi:DUF4382 domain-containing protein [Shewanella acanthi]|uniref:DUF4382 domain-containing protein n=1 Tax=Shewanella acanthi TaxID=2864212 RepID=UPI001C65D292|nr:DUF4382 domain-containing protein [Shewanella acanthi]QYJ79558.1 DUF4382 domain-containing protein [Shewanella acanthi]
MNIQKTAIAAVLAGLLFGCGGSDSNDEPQMATFSLGVSDNPADAKSVTIAFKQVVLKNESGSYSFNVASNGELKFVDLLEYQGSAVNTLVSGQSIPVGEYQMCIYMKNNTAATIDSSHVTTYDDGLFGLVTNSNGSCGGVGAEESDTGRLFFNKSFTIAAGVNSFVAEFDLSKGLQDPHGNKDYWTLKPTSVQLFNQSDVGSITGSVSEEVMASCEMAANGSTFSPAVYLYPANTTLEQMVDFSLEADTETAIAPITAARVNEVTNAEGLVIGHDYEFGFVVAGNYSLGYTCLAQNDDPEVVNLAIDADAPFFINNAEVDVTVTANSVTERNF